jgi:hypothetical protein
MPIYMNKIKIGCHLLMFRLMPYSKPAGILSSNIMVRSWYEMKNSITMYLKP